MEAIRTSVVKVLVIAAELSRFIVSSVGEHIDVALELCYS